MHPAYSVIFFTTASGAGYGLLALMGLLGAAGLHRDAHAGAQALAQGGIGAGMAGVGAGRGRGGTGGIAGASLPSGGPASGAPSGGGFCCARAAAPSPPASSMPAMATRVAPPPVLHHRILGIPCRAGRAHPRATRPSAPGYHAKRDQA